jgi:hypothetical protein
MLLLESFFLKLCLTFLQKNYPSSEFLSLRNYLNLPYNVLDYVRHLEILQFTSQIASGYVSYLDVDTSFVFCTSVLVV